MTMRKKLVMSLLVACLVPLSIVGLLSTQMAKKAMHTQAFNQLESLREVKRLQVEEYFQQIRNQAITFSEDAMIVQATQEFRAAFADLVDESALSAAELAARRDAVTDYYTNEFGKEYIQRNNSTVDVSALTPTDDLSTIAQYQYIAANPNPLGSKEVLDSANDGTRYSEVHAAYHPLIRNYLQKFEYYDIFLLDPETGVIIYSVFKELDYATSLTTGPYRDSNFARAFEEARTLGPGDSIALVDFEPYLPSYNAAASFIASPVYDGAELAGVLIFQMPVGKINAIMQERSGLGESGETYLVGSDKLMRSQSRFTDENTLLATEVDTLATNALIDGRTGSKIVDDYRGIPVLSSYAPISIDGLDWGILAEIDESEAFAAIGRLTTTILVSVFAGSLLAIALAFFLARSVGRQLGADPARLHEVVSAIANDDLTMDLSSDGPLTGVYAGIETMQTNLRNRIAADKTALQENGRIRQALDNVDGNVLIADANCEIIYMNEAMLSLMRDAEADFRTALPNFDANNLIGSSIEQFYTDNSDQHDMLQNLRASRTKEVNVGGRTIRIVTNPVFDDGGERLGTVVEWTDRTPEVAVEKEVAHVVESALRGDLGQRIDMDGKSGFFESLSEGVNQLVTIAQRVIDDTVRVLSAMAGGDLQQKIDETYEGSFDELKNDANATVEKLTEVVRNIQSSASSVKRAADEISQGNTDLSQRTEQQASSLGETASSMDTMTGTVRQNADNASQANQLAKAAREQAELGGVIVGKAVAAMQEINSSSSKIAEIIGVIDEIAFQTNLLALNASVEAARAGDQGRGFAVVASEVRNLAGRSAAAAKEIKGLIEDSGEKVDDGSRLVDESGKTLEEIVSGVKKVTDIVGEIATASQEQSEGIDEVNQAIRQMDELTQQNAALVEEAAAASESMGEQADDLNSLMTFFRISGDAEQQAPNAPHAIAPVAVERRSAERPWSNTSSADSHVNALSAPTSQSAANGTDMEWEEF